MPPSSGRYRRREREQFTVPLAQRTGPPPPPEVLPWYWTPGREGGIVPPAAFTARLHEIDRDLEAVYSPVHQRWLIWMRNPRIQGDAGIGKGWQLLFLWERPGDKSYLPLNELVFHNLYYISAKRFPNALAYFEGVQKEVEKLKADRQKDYTDRRQGEQEEFRQSMQISSAGKGNKFALHHDGTVAPGRSDANYRAETRRWRLPSSMIQNEKDQKEKRHYGR